MKQRRQNKWSNRINRINHLSSLKGYLIFVALSVASLGWLVIEKSWLASVVWLVVWLRLYRSKQPLIVVSCFLASLFFGGYFLWHDSRGNHTTDVEKEPLQVQVMVDPNSLVIDGDSLQFEGVNQEANERYALRYQLQSLAEKETFETQRAFFDLTGEVTLEIPEGQRNLNGFDYRQYLAEKGIYRVGVVEKVSKLQNRRSWQPIQVIKVWRRLIALHIEATFANVTASYMKSLFIGIKDSAFKNQQEQWGTLGILHFFSLSGMHVFFFVSWVRQVLLRMRVTQEVVFWCELVFLFLYLFLAGFSTSVGRSVFYVGISSLNRRFKWRFSELDCWSLTLLIGLALNPYLLFQAAGQLSFGLSFYIIYLKPIVARMSPIKSQLVFSVLLSLFAVPIMSAHFFEWHVLGIGLTFLLMPVFNVIILPSLSLLLAVSCLFKVVAVSRLVEGGLLVFQSVLGHLSTSRSLQVVTGRLPTFIYIICLALTIAWLHHYHKKRIAKWVVLVVIICLPSVAKYSDGRGLIAFVDVGQGDSMLIQRPFHQEAVLVDTGGRLPFVANESWQRKERLSSQAASTLIPFLKSRGIKRLDQVIITHAHEDHFGDLKVINQKFDIDQLLYPQGTGLQENFMATLAEMNEQTRKGNLMAGASWRTQDYQLEVLYPKEIGDGGNNDSLVTLLSIKDQKILLTGDLEAPGEEQVIQAYPSLSATILKVGHHGSRSSSTEAFLTQIKGDTGIISCGVNNRFGHPHEEVVQRLVEGKRQVYQTAQHGMVYYRWWPWEEKLSEAQTVKRSH